MSNDSGTKSLLVDAELSKKESLRILGLAIELGPKQAYTPLKTVMTRVADAARP